MAVATSFVHGNGVVSEREGGANIGSPGPFLLVDGVPWSDVVGLPRGWGKAYRGKSGQSVWFHASVPTPVREGSWQVALQDVFLLFNSENAAVLTDVHAWDGSDRFSVTGGLRVSGDRSHNPSLGTNAFQPRNADGSIHRMTFGLCVCMQFHFDADATVTFNSVGANFLYGG